MPNITILSWNIDGLGYLRTVRAEREPMRRTINDELRNCLIERYHPDFILLQEVVRYENEGRERKEIVDMAEIGESYHYHSSMVIDTEKNNHPGKWGPIREQGGWGNNTYLAQGSAILWKRDIRHCSIWEHDRDNLSMSRYLEQEEVRLDNGLYTGDRDSEPRTATVSRFLVHERDLLLVNLHLATLKGEREGLPERDEAGSKLRLWQLDIILNGIVSRYNFWRENHEELQTQPKPFWFLAGDFNGTEVSTEIQKLKRMRFQDVSPIKGADGRGSGTKRSKGEKRASITLDYIFAGIEYYAFDPLKMREKTEQCPPVYEVQTSDHFPVVARFSLED